MEEEMPLYKKALNTLSKSELFANLDKAILEEIIKQSQICKWEINETIDPLEATKYLFIIISGRLKLSQINIKSGRSVTLFLLSKGDIYDVLSLLDGKEHLVNPIPLDDMELLKLPLQKARDFIKEYPKFNEAFLPYLGKRMRELESFGESLTFNDTLTRLANLILRHTDRCKDEDEKHHNIKLINNLSHEALAELIGSVRTVVSLQLKKLKEENIVLRDKGELVVKDLEKLIKKCKV